MSKLLNNISNKIIIYVVKHSLPQVQAGYTIRTDNIIKLWMETNKVYTVVLFSGVYGIIQHNGITYYHLNLKRTNFDDIVKKKFKMFAKKNNIPRNTIVIATSNYVIGQLGYELSKLLHAPFYYDVRGFWELSSVANNYHKCDSQWFKNYVKNETDICHNANTILAITKQVKGELIKRGVYGRKIIIFENFIHKKNIKKTKKITRLKRNTTDNFVIGYFGSLCCYEGINDLVYVFNELNFPKVKLLIVGNNRRDSQDAIYENSNIMWVANITYNQIHSYYDKVDIICIPRRSTIVTELVSPIKLAEALEYNKHILLSNLVPMRDMVARENKFDKCTFFQANNRMSLKQKLEEILKKFNIIT